MIRTSVDEEINGPPSPLLLCGDQSNLPSPDVSRRLPAELLESVFISIARDFYIDEKKYNHSIPTVTAPSWVKVSYVCRYWRDVALNCPNLWSYIPPTSKRWTQELLARSQMAPLKLSSNATTADFDYCHYSPKEMKAQVLSIVVQVMNHSQRIQKLRLHVGTINEEMSKILFMHLPCLRHLDITHFGIPLKGKSQLLLEENTPALRTLRLDRCSLPLYALGPSVLTTLHLSSLATFKFKDTMANFLAMLRRMPHLVQLSIHDTLPSARLQDQPEDPNHSAEIVEQPKSNDSYCAYRARRRYIRSIANLLRWTGKLLAVINAIGVIVISIFQYANVFDSCYCNSSSIGWGSAASVIFQPIQSEIDQAKRAWEGGMALALVSCFFFVGSIFVIRDSLPL